MNLIMKLYKDFKDIQLVSNQTVVTIGMFDSFHLGHQAVLSKVTSLAKEESLESAVITFSNAPATYFKKQQTDEFIFSVEDKIEQFRNIEIDHLIVLPFDEYISAFDAKSFVEEILFKYLKIKHLVLGYDNHFGKGREGSVAFINAYYSDKINAFTVPAVHNEKNEIISSSLVKSTLVKGLVDLIPTFIGRYYYIHGQVIKGAQLGRQLGFKTANILLNPQLITPSLGVYAVEVQINDRLLKGVTNIGKRPSVTESDQIVIETHILDFDEEIYGQEILLFFKKKIRDEQKFTSLDALKTQISNDIESAKKLLA